MSLTTFLGSAGFQPDITAEANALVNAVHAAKTNFGYEIGSATSDEGGTLGKHVRAVMGTFQGDLDTGQKQRFIELLNNTYIQANASFSKLSSAMIALRDSMSSLASKIPATVTSELADTYKSQ